jgi:hypothetical protein
MLTSSLQCIEDDKRAALGGTAWARQAAVAVRRAAVASKAVPSPVRNIPSVTIVA